MRSETTLTIGSSAAVEWALRTAEPGDVEAIAELRAEVMRADLERLGRYDEHRVRQRFRDSFSAQHTSVIVADGAFAGCVTVRPAEDGRWLEHFYLAPSVQGRGLGSAVLRTVLKQIDADGVLVRLSQLTHLLRKLQEEPAPVPLEPEPLAVPNRKLLQPLRQLRNIHPPTK